MLSKIQNRITTPSSYQKKVTTNMQSYLTQNPMSDSVSFGNAVPKRNELMDLYKQIEKVFIKDIKEITTQDGNKFSVSKNPYCLKLRIDSQESFDRYCLRPDGILTRAEKYGAFNPANEAETSKLNGYAKEYIEQQ